MARGHHVLLAKLIQELCPHHGESVPRHVPEPSTHNDHFGQRQMAQQIHGICHSYPPRRSQILGG